MASIRNPSPEAVAAVTEPPSSVIDWPGVFVGVFISIAMSWLLLTFGSAVGLLAISPYTFTADEAGTLTIAAAAWFALTQIYSLALGAYIAARLRPRAEGPNRDELAFRDGVSGLAVWALAILLGLIVAGMTATSAARTGAEAVGAAANMAARGLDNGYVVDLLFRPAAATQNAQQPAAAAPDPRTAAIDEPTRGIAARILVRALADGSINGGDKSYLAQLIASRTGMTQQEAEQRIDLTINEAKNTALQAAEKTRKAAMSVGFWIVFITFTAGIACAWAGTIGGHHRDEGTWY